MERIVESLKEQGLDQIVKLMRERDHFVIAGHIGPDGDTIGSCYGLAMALVRLGKKAVVMLDSYPDKYDIIPGRQYLYCNTNLLKNDVFIALDCADVERLGASRAFFDKAELTICIDHHETNEGFADYNYIEPKASSTAEMVYKVIILLFGIADTIAAVAVNNGSSIATEAIDTDSMPMTIDTDIATAIYAGIVSDTGGFRYPSTSKSTMDIAARLLETGIPFAEINSEMMHRHTYEAAKALGLALEKCSLAMDGRIVYTYITKEMLASVGANSSDMDSIVEYLMSTRGAEVALFLYQRHQSGTKQSKQGKCSKSSGIDNPGEPVLNDEDRTIKVSMRSRGLHVGRIASALGGGGHRMAAGCTLAGTMEDVLRRVLGVLEAELKG